MSHTMAARCTTCGALDDTDCPEGCGLSSRVHGVSNQNPFHVIGADGYEHSWHGACADSIVDLRRTSQEQP